uniref:UORF n=1 Tax=Trypanosoma cruzi TaxID=5693 RepID=A0A076JRG1_TRYCR|nr:uORF [Trypanosoma cruzi]AII77653.1 uORF [Trypanosoma cruzi]
MKCQCCRRPRD